MFSNTPTAARLLRYPKRIKLVAVAAVLLFAAALVVAALAAWRQDSLAQASRENIGWLMYKFDRDAVQLLGELQAATPGPLTPSVQDELNLRFELLYSRILTLQGDEVSELLHSIEATHDLLQQIQMQLDRLDPMFQPYATRDFLPVGALEKELTALTRLTGRLLIAVNGYLADAATAERDQLSLLYKLLMSLIFAMSIAALLVIVFLLREMRESAEARRKQERLSQQLEATAEQARAASLAKSDFLAMVSHEIRTPLNGVVGMSELLSEPASSKQVEEYARTIHESANQLMTMINEILDFSKIEAGHLSIESEPTALKPLLDSVIALYEPRAHTKGIALTGSIDALVPAWVMLDASRVRQILLNLIANAVKFTSHGRVDVSVSSSVDWLRLEVRDTGSGLSADQQARLFEPFQQVDSGAARRHGGTGLGLAICKRLSDAMHGRLGLESALGEGSTFWCELPLVEAAPRRPVAEPTGSAARFDQARLLLVEDNAINRKVAIGLLSRLGAQVTWVENGQEALAKVAQQRFDLIFMDLHLPDMDGLAVTRALREQGGWLARVPIVAMTAGGIEDDRLRCLKAGMNDYLTKPLSLAALGSALARQLIEVASYEPGQHVGASSSALVCVATLKTLQSTLGGASLGQLVRLYRQQCRDYLAQLKRHLDVLHSASAEHGAVLNDDQVRQIRRVAHQLRGESLSLGAHQVARQASVLEKAASPAEVMPLTALEQAYQALCQDVEATLTWLDQWPRKEGAD